MNLDNIRVVMVETSHAGNIGAAARAMKTMYLRHLALVRPKDYPSEEATARASGAADILANALVVDSVEEALSGCELVIGASARLRNLDWSQVNARECAELLEERSVKGKVAILFGREYAGLTNDEMALCHYLLHVPTNPDYSSLNVAAAVQIVAYEVMMQAELAKKRPAAKKVGLSEFAPADEVEGLFEHMEQALLDIGFFQSESPRQKMMRRLRRLFNRAQLEVREVSILRGIFTAAQRSKKIADK